MLSVALSQFSHGSVECEAALVLLRHCSDALWACVLSLEKASRKLRLFIFSKLLFFEVRAQIILSL